MFFCTCRKTKSPSLSKLQLSLQLSVISEKVYATVVIQVTYYIYRDCNNDNHNYYRGQMPLQNVKRMSFVGILSTV